MSVSRRSASRELQQHTVVHVAGHRRPKSQLVAVLLALFLGPIGLFYASPAGGVFMLLVGVPLAILTAGIGLIPLWLICILWALGAAR